MPQMELKEVCGGGGNGVVSVGVCGSEITGTGRRSGRVGRLYFCARSNRKMQFARANGGKVGGRRRRRWI